MGDGQCRAPASIACGGFKRRPARRARCAFQCRSRAACAPGRMDCAHTRTGADRRGIDEALAALESAEIQLREAVYVLSHYSRRVEPDPQPLAQLSARL